MYIIDIFVLLVKPAYIEQEFETKIKILIPNRMKDVHFYIDLIAAFPSVIITEIVFHNFSNSSDYNSVYDMLYIMKIFKIR